MNYSMNSIEENKISFTTMEQIRNLLREDITRLGKNKSLPTGFLKSNRITKKLLDYNRRLIRSDRTNVYLDKTKVYNKATDKFISSPIDKRSGKIKKSFARKNEVFGSVVAPKRETQDFRFTSSGGGSNYELTSSGTLNSNNLLYDLIRNNKINGNYRIIITKNGTTLRDGSFVVDKNFWKNNKINYQVDSDTMIWNSDMSDGDVIHIIFTKETELPTTFYNQKYRDGVNHCVLHPIKLYGMKRIEESKSKSAKKKYNAFMNKVNELEIKYADGIPHDELHNVCERLQIAIDLTQPFGKTHMSFTSNKKPLKKFCFINTRLNHAEYSGEEFQKDSIYTTYDAEIVSRDELHKIEKRLTFNNEFFIFGKDNFGVNSIRTLKNYYRINNDYKVAVSEFEYSTRLNYCNIDALKYPELQKFINNGTHFNGTIDWYDTKKYRYKIPQYVKHIDMTRAYTQFKNCKWYNKFCLKITNFRRVDNYDIEGLYYIHKLSLDYCSKKFRNLNSKLNWFVDKNVYTSAELRCLASYNGKFSVKYGAYGIEDDFEFPDSMLEKEVFEFDGKQIKIPYYSKWCGMNCRMNTHHNFYMRGEIEYLKNIETDAKKWFDGNEVRISYEAKYQYNKKHITAQITAYQRLIMLEQLMEMDNDKIIRVCVDGIYYKDHEFDILDSFSHKTKMTFGNDPCENYLSDLIINGDIDFKCEGERREFYMKELFDAEGGNGKTYYNMVDKGLVNVVYVPHSEKLASSVNKEFGVRTSNHTRILTEPFSITNGEILKYGVYVVDECSMISENQKKYILDKCFGQVIFCGDLACQLKPINGEMMSNEGFDNIDKICVKNYRFKDERIVDLCRKVRDVIINDKALNLNTLDIQSIAIDDVSKIYEKDDIILVSRGAKQNKTSNLNHFWCEVFKDIPKFKVEKNSRLHKNGDIVFEKLPDTEFRHGYTIHSVQGETYKKNIFIDMKHLSDVRMFYTAISRANHWKQIYLVI